MTGELHLTVLPESDGMRLDQFLAGKMAGISRSAAQRLISEGHVLVDGEPAAKASARVHTGQDVAIFPPAPRDRPVPLAMALEIVYEDEDLAVINKPRGLVVHPAPGHRDDTLVNALAARWQLPPASSDRPGIVHRLDKDTTGLLVVAKSPAAMASLQTQIRTRTARRDYVALVHGHLPASSGSVEAPVGRDPRARVRMAVVSQGGRAARTRFRVIHEFADYSLLLLTLDTGRTHQIRVHMASAGYPVAGDRTYTRVCTGVDSMLAGQALHAWRLAFHHPRDGRVRVFYADPPPDFFDAVATLGLPPAKFRDLLSSLAAGLDRPS